MSRRRHHRTRSPHPGSERRAPRPPQPRPVRADLHIHTTASDSRWTPEQVVAGCRTEGIALLAVTDHDTVDAVPTAQALALNAGLSFLPGVEITTVAGGVIHHILGYGIDLADPVLRGMLADNQATMAAYNDADIRGLIELGYDLDYDEYLAYEYDRTRGGFKSLNYLIDKGLCTDIRSFFREIRSRVNGAPPAFPHPRDAVSVIRGAGGIPILAHPGASLRECGGVTEETLAPLLDDGIAGLEAYSQYHDLNTTTFCVEWCDARGLLITGGSDYHGGFVGRQLGVPVVDTSQLILGPLVDRIRDSAQAQPYIAH